MKIMFCLPGKTFSNEFLMSWTNTFKHFIKCGVQVELINKYSSNVYYARNLCLGGNNIKGKHQKPWQGKINYDYMMWIDSDVIFTPKQVVDLIDISEKYNEVKIVSGLYIMEDNKEYATVINWNLEYFKKYGRFEFLTKKALKSFDLKILFEVAYTGFGFMLIKNGVFEAIEYPWFRPLWEEVVLDNGIIMSDYTSEDVGFCRTITEKGFKIYIDPNTIVGHEKPKILY